MLAVTPTQHLVLVRLKAGHKLIWFGDSGPEMSGYPFWPQKRTVRSMLKAGLLKWSEYDNETLRRCGICEIVSAN